MGRPPGGGHPKDEKKLLSKDVGDGGKGKGAMSWEKRPHRWERVRGIHGTENGSGGGAGEPERRQALCVNGPGNPLGWMALLLSCGQQGASKRSWRSDIRSCCRKITLDYVVVKRLETGRLIWARKVVVFEPVELQWGWMSGKR